jgi:hypothetical protein
MEAERVLVSFGLREYDALRMTNISSGDHLNRVLEQMRVSYAPRPLLGSKVSQAAIKKWKAEVLMNPTAKKAKAGPNRATPSKTVPPPPKIGPTNKIGVLKITRPKAKPGPRGTSEIELTLVKHVGVSKKFHLLDVAALSYGFHAMGVAVTHIARVPTFDNLGDDSSPDVHGTPAPKRTEEKHAFSPSPASDGFLHLSFILL